MKANENDIVKIISKYDKTIRNAGAFLLEVEDDELYITDSCEGVDMILLNKELCEKLSDLFKELSDKL
jgi:flagellar motor component MotA